MWVYFRIWVFSSTVLYTVAYHSRPVSDQVSCDPGACDSDQVPARYPFLILLVCLLGINIIASIRLARKGVRIMCPLKETHSYH